MDIHNEIGHFREGKILVEVKSWYFWYNRMELIKKVVCICKNC
jgi:hypothetical protein